MKFYIKRKVLIKSITRYLVMFSVMFSMSNIAFAETNNDGFKVFICDTLINTTEELEIPIVFSNVPEVGINNCDFILNYDATLLEIVDIIPGTIIKNSGEDFQYNMNEAGKISFLFVDNTQENRTITRNGVFAVLKLKLKKDISSIQGLIKNEFLGSFNDLKLNEVEVEFIGSNIEVKDVLDVNMDGAIDVMDLKAMSEKINSTEGDSSYNINEDLNGDGVIDIFDLVILSKKIK